MVAIIKWRDFVAWSREVAEERSGHLLNTRKKAIDRFTVRLDIVCLYRLNICVSPKFIV